MELEVGETAEISAELLLPFGISVEIRFTGGVIVIAVIVRNAAPGRPGDVSIMFSIIPVPSTAQGEFRLSFFVLERKNAAIEKIVEPFLPDEVGAAETAAAGYWIR